ncbi:epoxide hydrolase 1-like isoform X2 [Gopherus flavomarginatus]|uniref:epoxide hydrolase 1-like isoform X2 n=1 Tax=Gopherus flavomarginatus TaxID=286002 RepID=UPI0021CBE05C|nr:epoxide hydrolase 1-like isoform X2 [Gopherus flavomarginatus]
MWLQILRSVRSFKCPWRSVILAPAALGAGGLLVCWLLSRRKIKTLEMGDGWWGSGERPPREKEDEKIRSFQIETSDREIQELHQRLDQARYTPPLEGVAFQYGFNSTYLQKVVAYWRNQFDWQKQLEIVNQYPHFKTTIEGFDTLAAARIFHKLMQRLGFQEFYVQGGDWGSRITVNMAQMLPKSVKGLHLNFVFIISGGLGRLVSLLLGAYVPWLVGLTREDSRRLYPYLEKNVYELLRETGYLHIQATKPDTAGSGLNDSPVGLAAYILEKFSTWTDRSFRDMDNGGLERKFSMDDLLTNVMIYWVTSSIVPSMRFYKENFSKNPSTAPDTRIGVYVPTGIAAFPQELAHCPRSWAKKLLKNIVVYSYMPRGGHFAAFEEPELLAQDIRQLVRKVEHL